MREMVWNAALSHKNRSRVSQTPAPCSRVRQGPLQEEGLHTCTLRPCAPLALQGPKCTLAALHLPEGLHSSSLTPLPGGFLPAVCVGADPSTDPHGRKNQLDTDRSRMLEALPHQDSWSCPGCVGKARPPHKGASRPWPRPTPSRQHSSPTSHSATCHRPGKGS